jgi:hypothetical protein
MVNYPAFQSGFVLEGTITTTDDAPADSLLATEEILAWEYRATHSAASFPGRLFTSDDTIYVNNTTAAIGVRITDSSIELPLATAEHPEYVGLVLGRQGFLPRGLFGSNMIWQSQVSPPAGFGPYRTERYEGDIGLALWSTDPTGTTGPNWLIATIVPEPGSGALVGIVGLVVSLFVRSVVSRK